MSSNAQVRPKPAYRADIDGLRAVAVLSVVIYHAFPIWGGGGFIGVDIFFVISGYLISSILFEGVSQGSFSYIDFYDRRVRRIFPALILVLCVCMLFAVKMAFPIDAKNIGKQVLSGAGFVSNLFFWNEAGYFDGASETKPLLHLWSLSVEEQYYIVWPLLVAALFKHRRWFVAVTLLLLAASFALNIVSTVEHQDAAFYSPLSRAWELLVGALLAVRGHVGAASAARLAGWGLNAQPTTSRAGRQRADALAAFGALLIVAGLFLTTPRSAFPGWWAVLPTAGAVSLIAAGSHAWFNRSVLSQPLFVFFGKISYPLYLWHWPLLAFPKIYYEAASRNTRIGAVVTATVLAWLTYRFVEKPIRSTARRGRTPLLLAGSVAFLAGCGALLIASDGWLSRLPGDMRAIAMAQSTFDYRRYREYVCFLMPAQRPAEFAAECSPPERPDFRSVWFWGDSHAASLYPGLQLLERLQSRIELTQFTAATCPPVLGMEIRNRPHCQATNDAVMKRLLAHPPNTLVMAANWTFYNGKDGWEALDRKALEATARRVLAAGVQHVLILGQLPRWEISQPTILLRQWRDQRQVPLRSYQSFNRSSFAVDAAIGRTAHDAGVDFISPITQLCDMTGCLQTVTVEGARYPIAWDDAHLTIPASEAFVGSSIGPWLTATRNLPAR